MAFLRGLASVADGYDGFIIDLWGVIHDGVTCYPGALACLERLRGKPVLLLSNAPRRAEPAREALRALGVADDLYAHLLTSGEATWHALKTRSDPWFAALGRRVYHVGPVRDRSVMEGLDLEVARSPNVADFLLNTGPDDTRDGLALDAFTAELDACLSAHLPMICANPDLEIVRGGQRIICAGALAVYYEAKGGKVRWVGKPYPEIYGQALALIGVAGQRILAIGDSLRTDIAGAAAAGLDSCWVLGGIHAEELAGDAHRAALAARQAGLSPQAIMPRLTW